MRRGLHPGELPSRGNRLLLGRETGPAWSALGIDPGFIAPALLEILAVLHRQEIRIEW